MTVDNTTVADGNQPNIRLPKAAEIGIYTIILNQTSTDNPTKIELHNTTGLTIVWTRTGTGVYHATVNKPILTDTNMSIDVMNGAITSYITAYRSGNDTIEVRTYNTSGSPQDALLDATTFTLKIYNEPTNRQIALTPPTPLYKIYTAIIDQDGTTAAPTAITLQNTIGGTPTYTRTDIGVYQITNTGKFTTNKTAIFINGASTQDIMVTYPYDDDNTIGIEQLKLSDGTNEDGFQDTTIEIKVYN